MRISLTLRRSALRFNLVAASLVTKFLPAPVSRYAQNVSPLIFTGIMAGNDHSSAEGE